MSDNTIKGIIVKGIAGFYYVDTDKGLFECKARGKFRNDKITPTVGDKAIIQVVDLEKMKGNVEEILPRRNELIRPKVCNIDQAVVVFAADKPSPNMDLLDRFILLIEEQNIDIVICINKIDIDSDNIFEKIKAIYKNSRYEIMATSIKTGKGLDELRAYLKDKISVFAGPSGVGKSSLLNGVQPNLELKTGEISTKIERGKHTTRHAELIELDTGGYIVDSPGFTSLAIHHIDRDSLQHYFREFEPFIGQCKFNGCSHTHEPGCAIINQVGDYISTKRYERYKTIYNELEQQRRNKYD
jgi:ribosome biogenesis GTPase